jgi:hypothetical protein
MVCISKQHLKRALNRNEVSKSEKSQLRTHCILALWLLDKWNKVLSKKFGNFLNRPVNLLCVCICIMAQAVSRRPLIAEAWARAWVSPYGICGGQSRTRTDFSPTLASPSVSFHRGSVLICHVVDEQ